MARGPRKTTGEPIPRAEENKVLLAFPRFTREFRGASQGRYLAIVNPRALGMNASLYFCPQHQGCSCRPSRGPSPLLGRTGLAQGAVFLKLLGFIARLIKCKGHFFKCCG